MSISRYKNVDSFLNDDIDYKQVYSSRLTGKGIIQKETSSLIYPSQQQINTLIIETEVWSSSTRLSSLAYQYYGDSEYWWVIGFFNKKPLDCMFSNGDIVNIPLPLDSFLSMIGL